MTSISKSLKVSKKKRGRAYEPLLLQPLDLPSRAETAKEKLRTTHEYDTLPPSELNQLASNYTNIVKLRELFETRQDGGGVSAGPRQRQGVSVKLFLVRPEREDREHAFTATGTVVTPDSIEVRFEKFCSYGINAEAALLVEGQYLKWTRDSLVIPRGMKIRDDSHGAQPLSLGDEKPIDLGRTDNLDQLLELLAVYNGMYYYHPISRNSKMFVRDALQRLGIKPIHPLLQVFDSYQQKIKTLQTLGIQNRFENHRELDEYYGQPDHATIVKKERNVEYLYFLCVCFHVQLGKATDSSAAAQRQICGEKDCCLQYLKSDLTSQKNLVFNDYWRLFTNDVMIV